MKGILVFGAVAAALTLLLLLFRQWLFRSPKLQRRRFPVYLILFDDGDWDLNTTEDLPDPNRGSVIRIKLPTQIMTFDINFKNKSGNASASQAIVNRTGKQIGLIALFAMLFTASQVVKAQTTSPVNPGLQTPPTRSADQLKDAGHKESGSNTGPAAPSTSGSIADDKNKDDKDKKGDKKNDDSELTPREKALLERIDKLEQRLAEVEAKTVVKTGSEPSQSAATTTQTGVIAGTAPGTTAAVPSGQNGVVIGPQGGAPSSQTTAPAQKAEPFTFADFTWLTGNPRTKDLPMDTKFFTPEVRFDVNYTESFQHPIDHTIGGSSEIFRSGEVQITQIGVGGDFHYDNVRGRLMTQFGLYSQTTPRNDASPSLGQWNLDNAYRYISEAYGGYHIDKMHGINVDAGIFMSYIGLYSYYQFDNWSYQPSYVSSNTPWFFNGVRIQVFPTEKLKIEPWIINGWQSYGKFNKAPGVGGQVAWRPTGSIAIVSNTYYGTDTLGNRDRKRVHSDDSIQVKYMDRPERFLTKAAFTLTGDIGCEYGGNVSCTGKPGIPAQYFLGFMAYNRFWFHKDTFAVTLGGGAINNPGRYLVLIPPINGATAASGTPYFTANPGDPYKAWDASATFDYMPSQYITFRAEVNHRAANVPYFSGHGGVTPPGGNTGPPGSFVTGFVPDLQKRENRITLSMLVKF